jgi:hypothetical protein
LSGLSREADAAGLGLTIVDRVVKNLDGNLIIESAADEGALITICLPICRSDSTNITDVSASPDMSPANDVAPSQTSPDKMIRTRSAIR